MTYSEKLKDPRWQKRRLSTLERYNWTCARCDSKTETLHVHHRYYVSGRDPWEYPDFCLVVMCQECHKHFGQVGRDSEDGAIVLSGWERLMDRLMGLDRFEFEDDKITDLATEAKRSKLTAEELQNAFMGFFLSLPREEE